MPCMYNGRPVKGNKGSCPDGSTWSDTQGDGKLNEFADITNAIQRRYKDKDGNYKPMNMAMDASTAAMLVPFIGPALGLGIRGATGVGGLMGKLFTKKVAEQAAKTTSTRVPKIASDVMTPIAKRNKVTPRFQGGNPATGLPIRSGTFGPVATQSLNKVTSPAIAAGRKFSPFRTAGTLGVGSQVVDYNFPFTEDGMKRKQARDAATLATTQANKLADQKVVDANATRALETQKESDRVAGLGFFDKMKEPGYWDTSITGVEGDDRLSRMGDLLTYYGMPPSGRAAAGQTPSEMWKQRSIDAAAAVAAGADTGSDAFSKVSDKTLTGSISDLVKDDYGNTWIPGDVMLGGKLGKEDLEAVTLRISVLINQISRQPGMSGMSLQQLYQQAKEVYEIERNA